MVKNHSKKNDARALVADGIKYTTALSEVSGVGNKGTVFEVSDKLTYKGRKLSLAEIFVSSLCEVFCSDFIDKDEYDELYAEGDGKGSALAEAVFEESYFDNHDSVVVEDLPTVPTSSDLMSMYGNWNDVNIAAGIKSFNGYIVAFTFAENDAPLYEGSVDGVSEWPNWASIIGGSIVRDDKNGSGEYNHALFSRTAIRFLKGTQTDNPNGTLAATELALKYADMASAIRKGDAPDQAVLEQWQRDAAQFTGADSIPNEAQLLVLEQARKYL